MATIMIKVTIKKDKTQEWVNPAHIIPVHTEHPDAMRELLLEREIVLLEDGNVLKI